MSIMDADKDKKINATEFMMFFGEKVYQLALQEALRDPEAWKKDVQAKTGACKNYVFSGNWTKKRNSTQIEKFLKRFDANSDGMITNEEIWKTFQKRKVEFTKSRVNDIASALAKLNIETV